MALAAVRFLTSYLRFLNSLVREITSLFKWPGVNHNFKLHTCTTQAWEYKAVCLQFSYSRTDNQSCETVHLSR